ncbi:DUF3122 domain-containing protein [Cyanobacterium sp. Dongsha4]|uniref:DUF3122 domain-containing protein n=1 Tax=Cyanobacterium sp. DS4 TaxID=2878255 RepID=UPI002E8082D6|nr:DUF3122 domain-containing protein [Cyanobacterium sp. Dongsha4]WVL01114.1 DUF3122 domain-containing protein [Cyanobacterium sp. Dongsha4]
MLYFWQKLTSTLVIIFICLLGLCFFPHNTFALTRQIEEAPQQFLTQSRHTLRDNQGNSWQVVFFQRAKNGEVKTVDLRLVAFPDVVTFKHPQPLKITFNQGKILFAEDKFAEQSPAPNVGEYDFMPIISQLSPTDYIELSLPDDLSLTIPAAIIVEWRSLSDL